MTHAATAGQPILVADNLTFKERFEVGRHFAGAGRSFNKVKTPGMHSLSQLKQLFRQLLSVSYSAGTGRRRAALRDGRAHSHALVDVLESRCLLSGITFGTPAVVITKGVVASTDSAAIFDSATGPLSVTFSAPDAFDLPFSGVIDSALIRTGSSPEPLNANLTNTHPGDIVRFAVLLENQSTDGAAFDVTFRDTLPVGVAYVTNSLRIVDGAGVNLPFRDLTGAADGSGLFSTGILLDDPGATNGSFSLPEHCGALDALSAGEPGRNIAIAFYDVTVQNAAGNTALLASDATLTRFSATEGGSNLSTAPIDGADVTLQRIDLEVTKQVSNVTPLAGDTVTWAIDVTNNAANATAPATGVVLRDTIPSGQSVVSGSAVFPAGGSFNETTGVWTVGQAISPGDTVQLSFSTIAGNSVEFASDVVDLELTGKVQQTTVAEGGSVDYTVTVTNNSEAATTSATGIVVGNLLPTGLTFVTHALSSGVFNSATGNWDLSGISLVPGQSESITIATVADSGTAGTSIPIAAEIKALSESDVDSTHNNASITEDDDFTQTITVKAAPATRTISGKAFLDIDNDGVNGGESGVPNITVNAYAPDGLLSGTAVTNATGDYTIAAVTTEPLRLEFVGFDTLQSVTTAQSPPAGANTFSSLAFLDAGTANLTADLALYQPTTQAQFVTTCFVYSGQSTLDPSAEPAVVTFNADGSVKAALASIAQVGATNGVAVHSFSGDQFVAAFQKRHSDIEPDGNSAIYRIDTAGNVSTFIRLDDFFGTDSTGVYSHDPANWFTDSSAFTAIGKTSLGDVDISEDGQFLYTVNLATRELIQIPIGSGGTSSPVDYLAVDTRTVQAFPILGDSLLSPTNGGIPLSGLGVDPTDNIRPFGLSVKGGIVYVGMVNSAETTDNAADLAAYVYTFNPATGQFNTTASVSFNLGTRTLGNGWQPWTSDWNNLPKFYESSGDFFTVGTNQPWLTDIEFDNNGDLVLGFRDRTGDQVGHMVGDPSGADSDLNGSPDRFYHDTKGDILRLRKSTATTWTVETGQNVGDGTEYYIGDAPAFEPIAAVLHPEAAQGGLALVPGFSDVATTAIDPQSFWAGGVIWLDNATGAQVDALDIYSGSEAPDIATFGKNNGLGDLEYTNNLSMEIGNRVWHDADKDGIQDAEEAALANVDLQLFDVSNPLTPLLVGSVTTNATGEYYFNDSNVTYADGADPVGLRPLTNYEIRVAASEFQSGGTLDQFRVTARNQAPVLVPPTIQAVSGAAAFDSNFDLTLDTARNQRIDVLTPTGLAADGVQVVISNATGGFARVEAGGTVVFEFSDGSVAGSFEYSIVDGRLDSDAAGFDDDADGVTDRARIALTSGAAGAVDHSLDLGLVRASVDLELTKLAERRFTIEGETVTFFVTLTNNPLTANLPATGVTVADSIPAGLTFVGGSAVASQGSFNGTTWTLPNPIAPGEMATLSYQVTVNSGTAGSVLINSAQVATLNETDVDSLVNNDDGDRSEDDEDDAVLLVGTLTSTTVVNTAQVAAASEPDFDSLPNNDDHDRSEDDEAVASYTVSAVSTATGLIGDVIWNDFDGDGVIDTGEPGYTGVAVRLTGDLNGDSVIDITQNTITNSSGVYEFTNLAAGTYSVAVTRPAGTGPTFDADGIATADRSTLVLAAGTANRDQDFGYRVPATNALIGDTVWLDIDGDGVQDSGESGLSGVAVQLSGDTNGDSVPDVTLSTATSANGTYEFNNLAAGTYTVTVTPPAGIVPTFDFDGIATPNTSTIALATNAVVRTQDFGYTTAAPTNVDLVVTKDNNNVQDLAAVGAIVTYTVMVTNNGPAPATNAVVTDTLPAEFTTATWTATGSPGTVFTNSGTGSLSETVSIPAAGTITYSVAAQLSATFSGTVTNTATVSTPQTDTDLTNNSATDVTSVSPLSLTPEGLLLPGQPFQVGARGMSHVALVPFIVGTKPGIGVVNGVTVGIADPQVFMIGFVCVDDRIIGVYDVPASFDGQKLYFQSYEAAPKPRLSNIIEATVGGPRVVATQTGGTSAVNEGSTTDSFSLVLSEAPVNNVVVDVQNQAPTRLSVSTATVTFTPANWNVPQSISLQAIDDAVFNGNNVALVRFSVRNGSDPAFVSSFAQTIEIRVTDNDALQKPGLTNSFITTQSQQPTITWSAVSGADSYDVWISSTLDVPHPIINTNVVGTSFTPTSPLGLGRLAVWVRSRTASGLVSGWSSTGRVDITTPPVLSSIPDGIDRRPTISWTAVAGATRYELWVNNTVTGVSKVISETALTGTTFTPTADLSFGTYAVWVRAVNQYGQVSSWSVAETFGVGPELLSPTGSTFNAQPTFTWTAVPGAATFEVYLRAGSNVIRQTGITTNSFTPVTPLPEGSYRWWVRGFAANGRSGRWSAPAQVTIGGRPAILTPVAAGTTTTTPQFTWTPVDGAASYSIYVSRVDIPGLAFSVGTLTTTSYSHSLSLAAGTYRAWLRSLSSTGVQSPWSAAVTFTVAAAESASQPDEANEREGLLAVLHKARLRSPVVDESPFAAIAHPSTRPASEAVEVSPSAEQQDDGIDQPSKSTADVTSHSDDASFELDLAMAEAAVVGWLPHHSFVDTGVTPAILLSVLKSGRPAVAPGFVTQHAPAAAASLPASETENPRTKPQIRAA